MAPSPPAPPQFTTKPGSKFRGLPTITQAGFNAWAAKQPKKPGGRSYEGYRTYLEKNRPGRAAGTPTVAKPLSYESLLGHLGGTFETPAQLEARATRMTNQGIQAQQSVIREEAKLMRDEARRRMEASAAAGRAASAQNAALFGQVGGEYNSAASEIANLGTNLGASMAGVTNADVAAQNAALASINAPGLTVGGPVAGPGLGGAQQQAVEAYRGATIPKQQIDQAGQAAQFGLAGMVTAQNLRATQEAQAAFHEATQTVSRNRTAAMKEILAGRPAQAAQYLATLQDAQRQQISLAMALLNARKTAGLESAKLGLTKEELAASIAQDRRDAALDAQKYTEGVRQFNVTQAENIRQFEKTLAAKKAELAAATKTGTTGTQVIATIMADLGKSAFDPATQAGLAAIYYTRPSPATGQPQAGSKDAKARATALVNYLFSMYWPSVAAATPKGKEAARKTEFMRGLNAWVKSAPLPSYTTYFAAPKG